MDVERHLHVMFHLQVLRSHKLFVRKIRVPSKNHRPATSRFQSLSREVLLLELKNKRLDHAKNAFPISCFFCSH